MITPLVLLSATFLGQVTDIGPNASLSWDEVKTDINGKPAIVAGYELAIAPPETNLNSGGTPLAILTVGKDGFTGTMAAGLIRLLADGPYSLQVRARDPAGNPGQWSDPLNSIVDQTPPAKVTGVTIIIQINVTVPK